jgi:type I restriction enzyme M protein
LKRIAVYCEISFTRYFYQSKPLRTPEEIRADIFAVQREAEGSLEELVQGASK